MPSDMLGDTKAYSGFAVDDLELAREFYAGTLGLRTSMDHGLMWLQLAGGRDTLVYPEPGSTPASYTILNFEVDDIDEAVDALVARGVQFERYEDVEQDEKGIARGDGPDIAWFKDPAGNVLSVLRER
jgi:catechol 2,3-dioxygenase-like lactoylglutathione lyase family enzyme